MGDIMRHLGLTAAVLCAMAGLTATTADAGGAVTTSFSLPLSGAIFSHSDPCLPIGETVAISGNVHVLSIIQSNAAPNRPRSGCTSTLPM
jgi:hypothetical protein